jgi:hypothetical protein
VVVAVAAGPFCFFNSFFCSFFAALASAMVVIFVCLLVCFFACSLVLCLGFMDWVSFSLISVLFLFLQQPHVGKSVIAGVFGESFGVHFGSGYTKVGKTGLGRNTTQTHGQGGRENKACRTMGLPRSLAHARDLPGLASTCLGSLGY